MRRGMIAGLVAACLSVAAADAQLFGGRLVYDPTNHAQNLLTAARSLREIQQQVEQLRNEAQMLLNQAQNLEGLDISTAPELQAAITRMRALIERAEGMTFEIGEIEAAWARDYPESYAALDHDAMVAQARLQWRNARDALGVSLVTQADIISSSEEDAAALGRLLAESQGAAGNLDATQAGNELIGLSVAQMLRLQQLLAAQSRAETLDRARALEEAEAARVRRERFLGDGDAYEPEG